MLVPMLRTQLSLLTAILLMSCTACADPAVRRTHPDAALLNLSLHGVATASGGNAGVVIDGHTDGDFFHGSVMENTGQRPWWQVDLGSIAQIDHVTLWNRTDCCSDRLRDFDVFVSDTPLTAADASADTDRSGVWRHYSPEQGGAPGSFYVGRSGRYVRVQLRSGDVLDLAEVQVFGTRSAPISKLTTRVLSPAPGSTLVGGQIIHLRAEVLGDSASHIGRVEFRADGKVIGIAEHSGHDSPGIYEADWKATEGRISLTADAEDTQGRIGRSSPEIPVLVSATPVAHRIPVILDTDIGGDADDSFALAQLLGSPELDIKLVVSAGGDGVEGRANLAAAMLEADGRQSVPLGVGVNSQHKAIAPNVVANSVRYHGKVYADGVGAMIDTIMHSPVPITLICIAPLHNIGEALRREPRIAQHARVVAMWGGFDGHNPEKRSGPEHNAAVDIVGSQRMLAAPWDITIAPLNTAGTLHLHGAPAARIRDAKTGRARNLWAWWSGWGGGSLDLMSLYDTEAVFLAAADSQDTARTLEMREIGVKITDDGVSVADPTGHRVHVAWQWRDFARFSDLLVGRIALDPISSKP